MINGHIIIRVKWCFSQRVLNTSKFLGHIQKKTWYSFHKTLLRGVSWRYLPPGPGPTPSPPATSEVTTWATVETITAGSVEPTTAAESGPVSGAIPVMPTAAALSGPIAGNKPPEQTNCSVYSVFCGIIFCRKLPNLILNLHEPATWLPPVHVLHEHTWTQTN